MKQEHTPEPWLPFHDAGQNMQGYQQSSGVHGTGEHHLQIICGCFKDIGGEEVASANANRIAECVNALAGLHPKWVKEIIASLQQFVDTCDHGNPLAFIGNISKCAVRARQALDLIQNDIL